jgi:hypothetical protein
VEVEDQEHLRRPGSDPPNARELGDHLVVGERVEGRRVEHDVAVDDPRREVAQRQHLVLREPDPAKLLVGQGEHALGHHLAERGDEAAVDRRRCRPGDLLVADAADQ